jgi:hypothetical protein
MTNVKMFIMGALSGTLFGATFLGALSHLLIIALAIVGAGALALAGRRRQLGRSSRKGLTTPPEAGA